MTRYGRACTPGNRTQRHPLAADLRARHPSNMSKPKSVNPADCKEPACGDTMDSFKKSLAMIQANKKKKAGSEKDAAVPAEPPPSQYDDCPLGKGELGNATWGLVHTTAAHYPDEPPQELQEHTKAFFVGLAQLYPCTYCRKDFKEEIVKDPPRVESRLALSLWACRQHNVVNDKLGKAPFECTLPTLDERWKTGKKSCWEVPAEESDTKVAKNRRA